VRVEGKQIDPTRAKELNMFDSIEDQMKKVAMEPSGKEKWTRYGIIAAISAMVVVGIFAIVEFMK
jgi:hypothetical protein